MDNLKNKSGKYVRAVIFLLVIVLINSGLRYVLVRSQITAVAVKEMGQGGHDTVFFGQSHTSYAIDSQEIDRKTGYNTMNMAIGGEYMIDMYYYVKEMYAHNKPRTVVLDLDYQYFVNVPKTGANIINMLLYNEYPLSFRKIEYSIAKLYNKDYRLGIYPWVLYRDSYLSIKEVVDAKKDPAYRNSLPQGLKNLKYSKVDEYKGKGFVYRTRKFSMDTSNSYGVSWNEKKVDYGESVKYLKKIVNLCKSKNTKVIIITSPITPSTLVKGKEEYNKVVRYMNNLAKQNGLIYYNLNLVKKGMFDRSDQDYWDYDGHMYGDSAERYSEFLGGFLKKVIDGNNIDMNEYFYKDIFEMASQYGG